MKKNLLLIVSLLILCQWGLAQEPAAKPRFWENVQTIKAHDKMYKPLNDPILFVGSSSIRKWSGLQVAFGHYNVLNRGIGGAVVNDVLYYLNDIVFPYKPRQIVMYVGSNDLVNPSATADTVFNRLKNLFKSIRTQLPEVPIAYISIQGAPSRESHTERIKEVNRLMKDFCAREAHMSFIDVFNPLQKDGKNQPELFLSDRLHLNEKGYAIWQEAIAPYLIKP